MTGNVLSHFTPSSLSEATLEATFVQRGELAQRLVDLIKESTTGEAKHFTLLVGPRGIGKTHLVSIVYHRLRKTPEAERLALAWLREEEWGVDSFLDLLIRILRALDAEYPDWGLAARMDPLHDLPASEAERAATKLLVDALGGRVLLLVVENVDELFTSLGDVGQKKLRAVIQREGTWTILATAPRLFQGVSLRTSPFYGFFRVHHLEELGLDDAIKLLARIAALRGDDGLASLIKTPLGRSRVRAVHHLAGGIHRVYVMFSQFLTSESLDELVEPVMRTLDDLTPYYQHRMSSLSLQQRKIVEFLCDLRRAVTVKQIARGCFLTHQTTSSQLKTLRELGFVRSIPVGRESFYELREPLMRFCMEVKKHRGEPIRLVIDFIRLWYSKVELERRLSVCNQDLERDYLVEALRHNGGSEENPHIRSSLDDLALYHRTGDYEHALQAAEELVAVRGTAKDWAEQGHILAHLGRADAANAAFVHAVELEPTNGAVWSTRAWGMAELGRLDEALTASDRAVKLKEHDSSIWGERGTILARLGRLDEALECLRQAADLNPKSELAWRLQGWVLSDLKRHDEAIAAYDRATAVDPHSKASLHGKARALMLASRSKEALETLDRIISVDQKDWGAWHNKGVLLSETDVDGALAAYDKATALNPSDLNGWHTKAALLGQVGRFEEGLAAAEKAIELGDTSLHPLFMRAVYLVCLSKKERARSALKKALARAAQGKERADDHSRQVLLCVLMKVPRGAARTDWVESIIHLYKQADALAVLAQALVASLPHLLSPTIKDDESQEWVDVWNRVGGSEKALEVALRLTRSAVSYRVTRDRRVLLELPAEERALLEPMLRTES